jgi:hypothetical protein
MQAIPHDQAIGESEYRAVDIERIQADVDADHFRSSCRNEEATRGGN